MDARNGRGGPPVRVVLADDHAILREGLRRILADSGREFVVGEAANGQELLALVEKEQAWDLIILDLSFPDRSGLDILRDLKKLRPDLPVLILSMHAEEQYLIRALKLGASGYLTKESAADELLQAVMKVIAGGRYVTQALAEVLVGEIIRESIEPHKILSEREREVLSLTARGSTGTEIAERLQISVKTVSTYRARILDKLGLRNNAELIRYAIQQDLL